MRKIRLLHEERRIEFELKARAEEAHARETETERLGELPAEHLTNAQDPGGYIVLDLPEEHRSLFVDFLKGFEEFAFLRGYRVLSSFDSQSPNQVAFKFTGADYGVQSEKSARLIDKASVRSLSVNDARVVP